MSTDPVPRDTVTANVAAGPQVLESLDTLSLTAPDVALVPRIWPVFVAWLIAMFGAIVLQIVVCVVWIVRLSLQGGDLRQIARDLPDMVTTPAVFIGLAALGQMAFALAAILPAIFSRVPTLLRLGLVRPSVPAWSIPIHAIGALVPLGIGIALAIALTRYFEPDPSVRRLYERMTWGAAGPFILFISIVPGFCEEMFFRGYIQRRLLERWSPWIAILVTSLLFGLAHIQPLAIAFAFVLGLWLGVLAWRTGSIWPGVAAHAFVNGSWNVWQIGKVFGLWPEEEEVPTIVAAALGAVALTCFAISLWILMRRSGVDRPAELPPKAHSTTIGA